MKKTLCMNAFVLVLLLAFLVGGCLGGDGGADNPEDVISAYWSAMQAGDFEEAQSYLTGSAKENFHIPTMEEQEEVEVFTDLILDKFDMKPLSHEIDNDKATVMVEVTSPDMGELMAVIMGTAFQMMTPEMEEEMTEEEIEAMVMEHLEEALEEAPIETYEVPVSMELVDGEWKISDDIDIFETEMEF